VCVRAWLKLREILDNIGVKMLCETFDRLYDIAATQSPKGHVSVDSFRGVMEQVQEEAVDKYKHKLGY